MCVFWIIWFGIFCVHLESFINEWLYFMRCDLPRSDLCSWLLNVNTNPLKNFHCWRYCLDKTQAHQQTALSLSVSKQNKFMCVVLCICCCSCMCVCPCLHAWLCMFIYVSCEKVAVYSCNSCCKFPERPFQFHDNSRCWNTCFSVSLWETFLVHRVKSQASWYSGVCAILTLGNTPVVPKTRKVLAP